jgi:hypothetical protein
VQEEKVFHVKVGKVFHVFFPHIVLLVLRWLVFASDLEVGCEDALLSACDVAFFL